MSAREVFPGVTVDPKVRFGRPHVRGVETAIIASRFRAGDCVADLAEDYVVLRGDIEAALRWELLSPYRKKRRMEGK